MKSFKEYITEGKGIDNLISIMNGWYGQGMSLSDIYDNAVEQNGLENGGLQFYAFVRTHKKDKKFMVDFNKTAFKGALD